MKKRYLIMGIGLLIMGKFLFSLNEAPRIIESPILANVSRDEKWVADIQFLQKELPKRHKNLFFYQSKEVFNNQIEQLINSIPDYTDSQIQGELYQIITGINDSHTMVQIQDETYYPVTFFEFEEGIYFINGDIRQEAYWGQRLVGINGYSIEEVKQRLSPYVAKDNEAVFKYRFSRALSSADLLRFSGILEGDEVTYTFEQGEMRMWPLSTKRLNQTPYLSESRWIEQFPLFKQKSEQYYWYDYMESENVLYVKYNACSQMESKSFSEFTNEVFEQVDEKIPQKLVIDLRENGGGNSSIFAPFLKEINKRQWLDQEERLYVIIGRRTFSSAVLNAMQLRNKTNATLIGEPTGGQPNHFGEVKTIALSNVDMDVTYSSAYFKTTNEDVEMVIPDKNILIHATKFFEGRDDFLDSVIES